MPPLPFRNNAIRKASEEPFFDIGDYEDEDEDGDGNDEVNAEDVVKELVDKLLADKLVTRMQLENIGPEGLLVGVRSRDLSE